MLAVSALVSAYVMWGGDPSGQPNRAQVSGTLWAAVVVVPPAFAWAWARRRPASDTSNGDQVAAAADLLATRMMLYWSAQVVQRGIQTPAPVRVRWAWAGDEVALSREALNDSPDLGNDPCPLAGVSPAVQADGQVLGSGLVTRLHDEVYVKLRHGRLVLIGGPGAGKTGAMILLLLEALRHRDQVQAADRSGVPVPVWLTLGSWNPSEQDLRAWVIATVARDHPYLRALDFGPDAIGQLFDAGLIALFLDGLDEMPDGLRSRAIERLAEGAPRVRVVLTSRPDEYAATLRDAQPLPYAAVVQLRPVSPRMAVNYLLEGQVGVARDQWREVTDHLRANATGVLAQTL